MPRRCSECGIDISDRNRDAVTCGNRCRKRRWKRLKPTLCVCGHALSSHRQDRTDPYISERCVTCGCAAFDNRQDAKMQGRDEA